MSEKKLLKNVVNDKMCRKQDFYLIDFSYLAVTLKLMTLETLIYHQISTTLFHKLDKSFKKIELLWVSSI